MIFFKESIFKMKKKIFFLFLEGGGDEWGAGVSNIFFTIIPNLKYFFGGGGEGAGDDGGLDGVNFFHKESI